MAVWFITGAARGLGAEITRAALASGHSVVAAARDPRSVREAFPDAGAQLLPVALDVTDAGQVQAAVDAGVEAFGRIDVLVNNAGRGLLGAVEEASDAEVRAVYETNVFGLLSVTRAVLPLLRAQRSGHVVNLSSVGGFVSSPGWGIYTSTKFAVEGFSESMALELAPLGIGVTLVEPGYFRTDFLDSSSLHEAAVAIEDYAGGPAGAMRTTAEQVNHRQPGDPTKAGPAIVSVIDSGRAPLRLQLGSDCVASVEAKLVAVRTELDAWREVAASTDHDDVGAVAG
ncbi:oxidoreductase [Promicromonospora sukumoe]|uniref:NAD(P)-dependent dehydrogenase (Short-subunit alcohol dehydrogenase family) n=1 Tax=Promicromonospora sukumoe TaxID=88382 RepID=A0A7W3J7S4_9MICO|nr:oxidoreductase [Promicromonospora sukumoe]MBA8807857.1 NAD(P)-dependent dehydrogenase (short-subunit alcohol dehydrogenase family) [Promicromonospora sukumoe]